MNKMEFRMKKAFAAILAALLLACAGCGLAQAPAAEPVEGIAPQPFTLDVNGVQLTNEALAGLPVYSARAVSVNSYGNDKVYVYVGYALTDVLAAAGVTGGYAAVEATADDGYTIKCEAALAELPTTLIAFERDGEAFEGGLWFAPCSSATSGDYLKRTVALSVDAEANAEPDTPPVGEGLPEISDKTGKIEFAPYSFRVNGAEVTNETLAALSIYRITVSLTNSKGATSEAVYSGYRLRDVLAACGIADTGAVTAVASDGYKTELDAQTVMSDYTLLAIEKDKETGEDGTVWIAPCEASESKAYIKMVVEILAGV